MSVGDARDDESAWDTGEGAEGVSELLSAAENVAATLRQSFHTYRQSRILCFRSQRGSGFWHCKLSGSLATEGSRLCSLLEKHAVLRLLADCEARVASFRSFTLALERLVLEGSEHLPAGVRAFASTADGGYSDEEGDGGGEAGRGGLARLSRICDELRAHLTHWSCLSRCALDSPRLRLQLRRIEPVLAEARASFVALRHASICWLERLAGAGVRAFARADSDASLITLVCSTVHGVEEFNALLGAVARALALEDGLLMTGRSGYAGSAPFRHASTVTGKVTTVASAAIGVTTPPAVANYLHWMHASSTNSPSQVDLRTVKAMSFVRFLAALAAERARTEAARSLHMLAAEGCRGAPAVVANDAGARAGKATVATAVPAGGTGLPQVRAGNVVPSYKRMGNFALTAGDRTDTSDYHSATGSALSVSGSRQNHHGSFATELSPAETELLRWSETEQDYVGKVIAIACHMTTMLQKNMPKGSALRSSTEAPTATAGLCSSKADAKRKSVSWGDSHDSTVKANLVNKYVDLLWKSFGAALSDTIKSRMSWGRALSVTRRALLHSSAAPPSAATIGPTDFCCTSSVLKFAHSLEKLAAGGTLPSSCARQLDLAALRIEATAMLAQWDSALCVVLASARADKCQPVPLADGQCSSKTAVLLRNAFGSLQSLQLAFEKRFGTRRKGGSVAHQPVTEYRIQWEILQRLQILADITEQWCQQKCTQFIYDFRLSPFLLVAYSDLPILATELGKSLCLLSCDGTACTDPFPAQWHRLSVSFGRTEALARMAAASLSKRTSSAANEFFSGALPPPKNWRKDASGAGSANKTPNSYVSDLTETVLQPLLDACRQLSTAAQGATIVCVVKSVLEAWMQQFLKQKVKFSWDGADQLEADVQGVREWLAQGVGSDEVKRSVLEAEPFRIIIGVVQLLKRQPCKRRPVPLAGAAQGSAGAAGPATSSALRDAAGHVQGNGTGGGHDSLDEMDYASAVPDKSAWLSLRQRAPGRAVRLLLPCMNASQAASLAV